MRLQVKGRHVDVTDSLFQYAEKKLGKLLPSYLKGGLLPVGEVTDPDLGKMPTVMNLQAITPTGSSHLGWPSWTA